MRAVKANMIPGGTTPTINVSQYDNDYAVTVTLIEGAEIYTPPAGATIRVEGTKPDGHGFEYPCTYQGNVVTMPIYTQMTVVSGRFPIELVVYQSGLRVGSCNIIFAVERAPLGEDTVISETVIPDIIAGAQAQADAAAASATAAASSATSAVSARNAAIEAAQAAAQSAASLTVDTELSSTSTNPVQNKVIDATVTELKNDLDENVSDLKSALTYKTDNVYGGTESSTDITLTNKKAWNGTSGNQQTSNARASSEQIDRTPDMLSIVCASGYSMTVYGNDGGAGNSLTIIDTTWVSSVDLENISYKYLFIVVKKSDETNFGDGTTTGVISIKKGTEVFPYATEKYADEKDSKKADARYTIADSQSATRNLTCNHGAFNATNGGSYSGSTFPKRGVVTPIYKENNYLKISAASGYLITVHGNDNGVGYSFDVISNNYEAEFSLENVTKKYIAVTLKKSDDADISAVDLSDKVILTYATTQAPYLTESEIKEVAGSGNWEGKKILWLGTSIPQQGYPQIVGTMLKADVTNNAEGSSMMRIGLTTYDNDPLGDDLGITGMYHVNVLKSLSMTQAERKKLFLGWTTDQRKTYLMAQGYSSAEVANVVGYANMMSGSFVEEDTDPATSGIPSQKPQDIWAGDGETYKDVREYSYGCCWDDSTDIESDLSVTGKVTGTITGKLKSYVLTNDWIFFDHFRNDATDATSELMLTIPTDKYDRHYAIGAFNYLIQQIYLINPNANVLIVGHYDNDDRRMQLGHVWEAQEKAANLWAIPIYKLWEESGIRALTQFTTNGYWDSSHVWHNTGYDGTNNVMNNLEELNENKRQIDGVWHHDLSLRQKWMWDDVHPLTTDCKNHIAKLISTWLKKKESDMDVR